VSQRRSRFAAYILEGADVGDAGYITPMSQAISIRFENKCNLSDIEFSD
jgi:hypothetical protein